MCCGDTVAVVARGVGRGREIGGRLQKEEKKEEEEGQKEGQTTSRLAKGMDEAAKKLWLLVRLQGRRLVAGGMQVDAAYCIHLESEPPGYAR